MVFHAGLWKCTNPDERVPKAMGCRGYPEPNGPLHSIFGDLALISCSLRL